MSLLLTGYGNPALPRCLKGVRSCISTSMESVNLEFSDTYFEACVLVETLEGDCMKAGEAFDDDAYR